jgi:hypothetical protein
VSAGIDWAVFVGGGSGIVSVVGAAPPTPSATAVSRADVVGSVVIWATSTGVVAVAVGCVSCVGDSVETLCGVSLETPGRWDATSRPVELGIWPVVRAAAAATSRMRPLSRMTQARRPCRLDRELIPGTGCKFHTGSRIGTERTAAGEGRSRPLLAESVSSSVISIAVGSSENGGKSSESSVAIVGGTLTGSHVSYLDDRTFDVRAGVRASVNGSDVSESIPFSMGR